MPALAVTQSDWQPERHCHWQWPPPALPGVRAPGSPTVALGQWHGAAAALHEVRLGLGAHCQSLCHWQWLLRGTRGPVFGTPRAACSVTTGSGLTTGTTTTNLKLTAHVKLPCQWPRLKCLTVTCIAPIRVASRCDLQGHCTTWWQPVIHCQWHQGTTSSTTGTADVVVHAPTLGPTA